MTAQSRPTAADFVRTHGTTAKTRAYNDQIAADYLDFCARTGRPALPLDPQTAGAFVGAWAAQPVAPWTDYLPRGTTLRFVVAAINDLAVLAGHLPLPGAYEDPEHDEDVEDPGLRLLRKTIKGADQTRPQRIRTRPITPPVARALLAAGPPGGAAAEETARTAIETSDRTGMTFADAVDAAAAGSDAGHRFRARRAVAATCRAVLGTEPRTADGLDPAEIQRLVWWAAPARALWLRNTAGLLAGWQLALDGDELANLVNHDVHDDGDREIRVDLENRPGAALADDEQLCAVRRLRLWTAVRGPGRPALPESPVFPTTTGRTIGTAAFSAYRWSMALRTLGKDAHLDGIGVGSLRPGYIVTASQQGYDDLAILAGSRALDAKRFLDLVEKHRPDGWQPRQDRP